MTESTPMPTESFIRPFAPSWIDYLIQKIERIPGPAWVFYLIVLLFNALINNILYWLVSDAAVGTLHPLFTFSAVYTIYGIGFYHYVRGVALTSLHDFIPVLGKGGKEESELAYRMTHLPASWGWLALILGMIGGIGDVMSSQSILQLNSPVILVYTGVLGVFNYSSFFALLLLTARQLYIVVKLHHLVSSIDLFNLNPLRAFSRLTATAGFAIFFLGAFSALVYVDDVNTSVIGLYFSIGMVGLLIFIIPLLSIRNRITKEKKQKVLQTDQHIRRTLDEVSRCVHSGDLARMGEFQMTLNVLEKERVILKGISSFPWSPDTFKSFLSTILIPILIWLIRTVLEKWV